MSPALIEGRFATRQQAVDSDKPKTPTVTSLTPQDEKLLVTDPTLSRYNTQIVTEADRARQDALAKLESQWVGTNLSTEDPQYQTVYNKYQDIRSQINQGVDKWKIQAQLDLLNQYNRAQVASTRATGTRTVYTIAGKTFNTMPQAEAYRQELMKRTQSDRALDINQLDQQVAFQRWLETDEGRRAIDRHQSDYMAAYAEWEKTQRPTETRVNYEPNPFISPGESFAPGIGGAQGDLILATREPVTTERALDPLGFFSESFGRLGATIEKGAKEEKNIIAAGVGYGAAVGIGAAAAAYDFFTFPARPKLWHQTLESIAGFAKNPLESVSNVGAGFMQSPAYSIGYLGASIGLGIKGGVGAAKSIKSKITKKGITVSRLEGLNIERIGTIENLEGAKLNLEGIGFAKSETRSLFKITPEITKKQIPKITDKAPQVDFDMLLGVSEQEGLKTGFTLEGVTPKQITMGKPFVGELSGAIQSTPKGTPSGKIQIWKMSKNIREPTVSMGNLGEISIFKETGAFTPFDIDKLHNPLYGEGFKLKVSGAAKKPTPIVEPPTRFIPSSGTKTPLSKTFTVNPPKVTVKPPPSKPISPEVLSMLNEPKTQFKPVVWTENPVETPTYMSTPQLSRAYSRATAPAAITTIEPRFKMNPPTVSMKLETPQIRIPSIKTSITQTQKTDMKTLTSNLPILKTGYKPVQDQLPRIGQIQLPRMDFPAVTLTQQRSEQRQKQSQAAMALPIGVTGKRLRGFRMTPPSGFPSYGMGGGRHYQASLQSVKLPTEKELLKRVLG